MGIAIAYARLKGNPLPAVIEGNKYKKVFDLKTGERFKIHSIYTVLSKVITKDIESKETIAVLTVLNENRQCYEVFSFKRSDTVIIIN